MADPWWNLEATLAKRGMRLHYNNGVYRSFEGGIYYMAQIHLKVAGKGGDVDDIGGMLSVW